MATLAVGCPWGEAQLATQQLPTLLEYPNLKGALLQWVGCTLEKQHQRFHVLAEISCLFAFAQQRDGG